ncbi:uncharacterized protein LOC131146586 [Malania oleifera]|uniref:uncharacterized protein LOC131146586 n=1 Tax=Malania oleifera TaxID=397392 RepID=UPI0025AE0A69|nr:uncharacterized protein LOC131146586 [Malania oleifera]
MASHFPLYFLFSLLLLLLPHSAALGLLPLPVIKTAGGEPTRAEAIAGALSDHGYGAMSMILHLTLHDLIKTHNNSTALTIFCPQDAAFFSLKFPQPPLTLLRYHFVPRKLEQQVLGSAGFPVGSKLDTLLPGHPLVVTAPSTVNGVRIADWDIYDDGVVTVHGVGEFFDPAFQTLRYPWYDGAVGQNGCGGSGEPERTSRFFWDRDYVAINLAEVLVCLGTALLLAAGVVYFGDQDESDENYGYIYYTTL